MKNIKTITKLDLWLKFVANLVNLLFLKSKENFCTYNHELKGIIALNSEKNNDNSQLC
jgi:hypothetical protein